VDISSHPAVARALLVLTALLSASAIGFGLAGSFALAIATQWAISAIRTTIRPLYTAWLSQQVDSRFRATAISMSGQADSLGQIAGGPGIGAIATVLSLRTALAISGVILSPALLLYARTVRTAGDPVGSSRSDPA
jgi:DHA3 family tetracycline resistance protein-like MFS transporter